VLDGGPQRRQAFGAIPAACLHSRKNGSFPKREDTVQRAAAPCWPNPMTRTTASTNHLSPKTALHMV